MFRVEGFKFRELGLRSVAMVRCLGFKIKGLVLNAFRILGFVVWGLDCKL